MKIKHYLFQHLDRMSKSDIKKTIRNGGKTALQAYLKSVMSHYVAKNKLQNDMKGDETAFCNMLAEEFMA